MDSIPDWIFPLVFAAIYFLSNVMSKKGGDAEELPPPSNARSRETTDEEAEAAERQRRIQEEIRRKIMERRQGTSGERTSGSPTAAPPPLAREATAQRSSQREQVKQNTDRREALRPPSLEPRKEPAEVFRSEIGDAISSDALDTGYGGEMQQQLRQIEATKRQAEKLRRQANATRQNTTERGPQRTPSTRKPPILAGPVRSTLTNPIAARSAFIYGEVLGPPKALKKAER